MKRLLAALIPLALAPLSTFAISLSEIQDNPQKYIKVVEDANAAFYVDVDSIKSLRYSPPYYTLQCSMLLVAYDANRILDFTETFNYDLKKSPGTRYRTYETSNSAYTEEQILKMAWNDAKNDCGVIFSSAAGNFYDFDGAFLRESPPLRAEKAELGSNIYICADFMFNKYYGIDFTTGMK